MSVNLVLPAPATELAIRQQLARVPITQPPGLLGRALAWYSRRTYGTALDNGFALAHNKRVLFSVASFERRAAKWNKLDKNLGALAAMATAADIGCSWCVDFGYYLANSEGLDLAKLQQVRNWRTSEVFTEIERQVIELAHAMTTTPTSVTDDMVAPLRAKLGDAALVELTMMIALENERSRFNSALGLVAQGFSAACQLPSAAGH